MEKRLFRISENAPVASGTYRLRLEACEEGYEFSGEFVDIALDGFYLRRPLSVCDSFPGGIILLYKVVGAGTEALSGLGPGQVLDVLTGLGKGFDPSLCKESALLVGGGLGAAPLLPLCKALKKQGKKVNVILGFNTAADMVLADEYAALADSFSVATMDGSEGHRGLVTDVIDATKPSFDCFYTCGPLVMMKAVCLKLDCPGEASLEERMGCGAGFCYGCSCKTLTGTKRICADGPVFNKEDILW